jgi:hypothetical protein
MAHYNFIDDIKEGNDGEFVVAKVLVKAGAKIIHVCADYKYDLKVSYKENIITYEIKTDVYVTPNNDSGNIFIEKESWGKLSGISVTKSDWFVTYFKYLNELWSIRTNDLKELIDNNKFTLTTNSGDANSGTRGYLIPRILFKKHFKIKKIN